MLHSPSFVLAEITGKYADPFIIDDCLTIALSRAEIHIPPVPRPTT